MIAQKKISNNQTARSFSAFLNNSVSGNSSDGVRSDVLGQSCETMKKFCSDLNVTDGCRGKRPEALSDWAEIDLVITGPLNERDTEKK